MVERSQKRKLKAWDSHSQASRERRRRAKGAGPRAFRASYSAESYRRAITRACKTAGVAHFHPHQIRHTVGTEIRRRYGLEAAQAALGHAELGVTQVYAERDMERARSIMREVG